ncbi:hypothetical protein YPPY94_3244, partial [Yersinia pestis PY-94]
MRIGRGVKRP